MQDFVASVKDGMLKMGKEEFESEVRRFEETYEEQGLDAWRDAEVSLDAVNKERGKGRMKDSENEDKLSRGKQSADRES
jgi:hypothetical protein